MGWITRRVSDNICDGIRPGIPQATEWQRIRNQIDAAMIFARADFVEVWRRGSASR